MAYTQADIDICQSEIDELQNKIRDAEWQKADNLRQRDRVPWGYGMDGSDYMRAAGATEAKNSSLDFEISEWQKYLKPLYARLNDLIDKVHPEIKAERERKAAEAAREKAEAERNARKIANDRRYGELINELSEIAAKPVNDDISSSEYRSRIDALDRIKSGLKGLPGDYDTAAYLEQCGSLHGVFEKSYNDRTYKELTNELSEIAAQPVNDGISSYTYSARIDTLDQIKSSLTGLSGAYDTAAYLEKCDSLHGVFETRRAAAEKREAKEQARQVHLKEAKRVVLSILYFAAIGGLLFLLYYFRHSIRLDEYGVQVVSGILAVLGAICGFAIAKENSGCAAVLVGIPIGGGVGFLIGYILASLLGQILWLVIAAVILVLSIVLYRKLID
jgi:hypothetical protein